MKRAPHCKRCNAELSTVYRGTCPAIIWRWLRMLCVDCACRKLGFRLIDNQFKHDLRCEINA